MNKKFLSAILFGALMVSSTGTFVSCKDYDDDIDNLQGQIDGVKSQIAALESKINKGKWITSVTSSADGLTITMSDGQTFNITNGKNGTNGTNGTEWTISEDGFWVCNGEKTDVKAVGKDGDKGETGEAGQQEVKFENGKWYLWNGTEFVEFKGGEATTGNVPFYYTDPNDQNYAVLVVFDENGQNKKEIRLPLNEGLAEIMILDNTRYMYINYHRYNGTDKWNGAKPLPAKGEYLITQPTKSFLIQVTPANYDLSTLDLKLVNTKGEEAPVVLGKPAPFVGDLSVQPRAVSTSGIFEVTVDSKDFSAETIQAWEDNFRNKGLSLVANESVRSTYSASLWITKIDNVPTIYWDNRYFDNNNIEHINGYGQNLNEGNEIIVAPQYKYLSNNTQSYFYSADQYVYDAFVTMAASSKADSIKAGVSVDGTKITAQNACNLTVVVNYVNAMGQVKKAENVEVRFYDGYIAPEIEDFALAATTHQTVTDANKQTQLVDFSAYFTKYANDEASRILWNADAQLVQSGQVEIDGTIYSNIQATWEHENEYGDIVTSPVYDLVKSISFSDKNGNIVTNDKVTHLNIAFTKNYGSTIALEKGKVTVYATVQMKQADGYYAPVQTIAIPVTLKNPTAADIAASYAFNPAYFKDNTLTILDATTVKVSDYVTKGTLKFDAEMKYDDKSISVNADGNVTLLDTKNMGKSYTISGVQTEVLGRRFDISFAVKFASSKTYELVVPKALSVACEGANEIKVKYGDLVKNDGFTYNYKLTNFAGVLIEANQITSLKFFADADCTKSMTALNITPDNNKNLTIKSTGDKIANDITVTVYAQFVVGTETIVKSFNVTVTGAL